MSHKYPAPYDPNAKQFRVITLVGPNSEIYDVRESNDFAWLYYTGRKDIRYLSREYAYVAARMEDTRGNFIANVAQ
jgi:hypothetical protein